MHQGKGPLKRVIKGLIDKKGGIEAVVGPATFAPTILDTRIGLMETEDADLLSEEEEEDENDSIASPDACINTKAAVPMDELDEVLPEILNSDNGLEVTSSKFVDNSDLAENSCPIIMDASDEWTDQRIR